MAFNATATLLGGNGAQSNISQAKGLVCSVAGATSPDIITLAHGLNASSASSISNVSANGYGFGYSPDDVFVTLRSHGDSGASGAIYTEVVSYNMSQVIIHVAVAGAGTANGAVIDVTCMRYWSAAR